VDVHARPASLIGLERDLLSPADREAVLHHLAACPLCTTRQAEIQAELALLDSTAPAPGPAGRHIPAGILAGFVASPELLGADLAGRIAQHVARCPRCSEAAARATRPRPEPRATVRRPIPLAPFLRFRRGVTVHEEEAPAAGRRPTSFLPPLLKVLFGRSSWPVISALVLLALIGGLFAPRWLAARRSARHLNVATPLRLLGNEAAVAPAPTVTLAADTPLALFIKLPVPPRADGQYELVLRRAGGGELARRIPGTAFDPSGTVSVVIAPGTLRPGERVEVRVDALDAGTGGVVFADAFTIEPTASGGH
jgi:hypothetical protein